MAGEDGPPVELVHRSCGRRIMPTLACPECGEPVGARDMQARPGPALRKIRTATKEHTKSTKGVPPMLAKENHR
jgi:hypothetical protein